ncbi:MAG TPA: sensor histidine kinase [Pseudonocardia sp.]
MSLVTAPRGTPLAEPFVHPALFYRGREEYLAGTLPFIEDGLAAGDPVAVAAPPATLELVRAGLGGAAAHVRFVDMWEAGRNPGRIIPGVLRDFADAHPDADRVRIIGEPIWPGRTDVEYPACVQHEALINLAFAGRNVTILCPYDADGLPPEVLADAEATHPTVIDSAGPRISERFDVDGVLADCNRGLPETGRPRATLLVGLAELTWARRLAVAEARRAGLEPDRVADFELVVCELATNSIEHGGGSADLAIWHEDGHLVAEVSDGGLLRDPLAGRRPVSPGQLRGRGLIMINYFVDLVRVHRGDHGTTIRVYLRT